MARLEPLSPPFDPAAAEVLAQMPADLALFRTVAHNPRVLSRWRGGGLLDKGSVSLRQREIVILRTTARLGAEYERSEEHTSELQSLMRISYAVFCLKKKKNYNR